HGIHCNCWNVQRYPGTHRRLASRVLPGAALQYLAGDDLLDFAGINTGTSQRSLGRVGTELGARHGCEDAVELHEWGARVAHNLCGHAFRSSTMSTANSAAVISLIVSTLSPGATPRKVKLPFSISNTARSVMMRLTTPTPVSGRSHFSTIFEVPSLAT